MGDETDAECSECGESHADDACWDEANDAEAQTTDYPLGEKRPLDNGVKVRAKVKRGSGTRDQDELLLEGRGGSAAEAAADFEAALQRAEELGWSDRLRELQPGEDDGE